MTVMGSPRPGGDAVEQLDVVFVALADPTRRALLDRLLNRDGQRVSELAVGFSMSRQAISKHLDVLEGAGLVVLHRQRRETRIFLDRRPLRRVMHLWLERFTQLKPQVDCF